MSEIGEMLADKSGEGAKSKKAVIIALIVGAIIFVLVMVFRNAASGAASGGGSTSTGGGGTTTTTSGSDTNSLEYQKGLADIQNSTASFQEKLQEKLVASQLKAQEDLTTFTTNDNQKNVMNQINDLIYQQKATYDESTRETLASVDVFNKFAALINPPTKSGVPQYGWQMTNDILHAESNKLFGTTEATSAPNQKSGGSAGVSLFGINLGGIKWKL